MNKSNFIAIIIIMILPLFGFSQGWEKTYDGPYHENVVAIDKTLDGGIVAIGIQIGNPNGPFGMGTDYPFLSKFDMDGNLEWQHYDTLNAAYAAYVREVIATSDGGYLLGTTANPPDDFLIEKRDANGLFDWNISADSIQYIETIVAMEETTNGDIILLGSNGNAVGNGTGVAKIDMDGNVLWDIDASTNNGNWIKPANLTIASNGDIIFVSRIYNSPEGNFFVERLSSDGNFIWKKEFNISKADVPTNVIELSSGEIVFTGNTQDSIGQSFATVLIKLDASGNEIWTQSYFNSNTLLARPNGILSTDDGGLILSGNSLDITVPLSDDIFLLKVDALGNELWIKEYGRGKADFTASVLHANDKGFYLMGATQQPDDDFDVYLIKTDSLGNSYTNQLSGNLYYDINENCTPETGEQGMPQWLVQASNGVVEYMELTDTLGNFEFTLDTGTYQITAFPTTPYWGVCNNNFDISFSSTFDTIAENIGIQAIIDCPLLDVSIGTPFLRRCFENTYTIQYCNYGTTTAPNAYVEIDFDTAMIIENSSIPISSQAGNFLTFDLGDVAIGDCGSFTVDIMLADSTNCDSVLLGATHCVEAHIYPDSICLPSNNWSGASIELDAICTGDSIHFIIKNVGTAASQPDLKYWVIEDDVILYLHDFGLPIGGTLPVSVFASGATYRLEAEQEPNHPGMSMPSISVEGCVTSNGFPTLGFINIFSQDDGDTFVDIDCQQNIGAYDPNDKQGFPLGYGNENYINRGQEIEYFIRFQNTGTDTAFNIVVLDTLSELLDITTVRAGASSHPYEFNISTGRELSFRFDNIMLPDSNVNQYASNGFVKFKVSQIPNLDLETEIHNNAAIYFDFNPPIFTNQTLHTVGENYITVSILPLEKTLADVKIFPNPFSIETNIEIQGMSIEKGTFKLFDVSGRLIRSQNFSNNIFTFSKKDLHTGMYFFTIENDGLLISSGKLIAQ